MWLGSLRLWGELATPLAGRNRTPVPAYFTDCNPTFLRPTDAKEVERRDQAARRGRLILESGYRSRLLMISRSVGLAAGGALRFVWPR